ncbi:PREDICTED: patellin-4-like [Populus euphratica]|uniref:Patellin-4-like n=1 Tax=Populus euphratica TaxID=75702 RepID=A0AAJ6T3S0_POPEU|nr:PREDICTED: patellin-4-like [Populus euphratica]
MIESSYQQQLTEEKIEKRHQDNEDRMIKKGQQEGNGKKVTFQDQEIYIENLNQSAVQENEETAASIELEMRKQKALNKFRSMVEGAIIDNYLLEKPKKSFLRRESEREKQHQREISLWGVPLLPSKGHASTDLVLLKFLTAKDFKVNEAFKMLRNALNWRNEYRIDAIPEENLHVGLEKFAYINSVGKQGQPVHYILYGAFKDKELYRKVLGTEENREKFLRLRIQLMEKSIEQLSFKAGGADSILQITDLRHSPGPEREEFRSVHKRASTLIQANYPELIQKHILINVPFWYYTSRFLTSRLKHQRGKKKVVLARPSKVTKTLLKYISSENLPVKYGGLKRENDTEFFPEDKASELIVKPNSASCIQIPVIEAGVTIVWDFTVVGWEVTCKQQFIPDDEGSYEVLLRKDKEKKMGDSVRNSFYISEPGKIVITIDNATLKKKRVYYRSKAKPTAPPYIIFKKQL